MIWKISDYARKAGMPKRTARDLLFRAHAAAIEGGSGGWLFRIGWVWYVNADMLIAANSPLVPIASIVEQLTGLRVEVDELKSITTRLASSVRYVARTSSVPPPR